MWHQSVAALALSQLLVPLGVQAAATWPSSIDEIENLMMLQTGYNAPGFASAVTPCSNSYAQGFRIAAGFLRTAFHDVAAYDATAGTGGLDASIGFELGAPYDVHNNGPDFYGAMTYYSSFFNSKATMADLVALGVYASVRSCGGPQVAIRAGRIDATGPGPNALPDAADSQAVLTGRFAKMGFSPQEMVQLVACGHTLGGVHPGVNAQFNPQDPNAAAQAAQQGVLPFDTTDAAFDNRVATEYVSGTSKSPLVNGNNPNLNSDLKVFTVDNNVTIRAMTSSQVYQGVCQAILQKMIERVPSGVSLSDVIQPYDVKPGQLNLNVVDGGKSLLFSGEIRIRTTQLSVASVQLQYLTRPGDAPGVISTTKAGDARGFDDSFSFFGFSQKVPSITSFTVLVTTASGAKVPFTNNGQGFPVNDGAFVQMSSSSLSGSQLKVVVAVRGNQGVPSMSLSTRNSPAFNTLPTISKSSCSVSQVCSDSTWSYYTGTFNVNPSAVSSSKLDVSLGGAVVDGFRSLNFPSSGTAPVCGSNTTSTTSSSTTTKFVNATSSTTSSLTSTSLSSSRSSTLTSSSSSLSSSTSSLTSSGSSSSGSSSTSSQSSTLTSSGSSSSGSSSTTKGSSSLTSSTSSGKTSVSATLTSSGSSSGTSSSTSTSDSQSSTSDNQSSTSSLTTTTSASSSNYGSSLTTTDSTSATSEADTSSTWTTTTGTETWTQSGSDTWTTSSATWTDSVSDTWTTSSATWTSSGGDMWNTWTESESVSDTWTSSSSVPAWTAWEGVSSIASVASSNHASAIGQMSSIYQASAHKAAPSGGSDGGNKNIQGLDLSIVVSQVPVTITATTVVFTIPDYASQTDLPAYGGSGSSWAAVPAANTWSPAPAGSTWAPAPGQSWASASVATGVPVAPASSPAVAAWTPYASATKSGWVATYTGGADTQVIARKEAVMGAIAVVFGAVVMAL